MIWVSHTLDAHTHTGTVKQHRAGWLVGAAGGVTTEMKTKRRTAGDAEREAVFDTIRRDVFVHSSLSSSLLSWR